MKLVSITLESYRRFSTRQKCVIDSKLVSILGPNEAGKTTLLKAIERLGGTAPFVRTGASIEVTRGKTVDDDTYILEGTFFLDEGDKNALSDIPEASHVKWITIRLPTKGGRDFILHPDVVLSAAPRRRLAALISALTESRYDEDLNDDETLAALDALGTEEDIRISKEGLDALHGLSNALEKLGGESPETIARDLKALIEVESKPHPWTRTVQILERRIPKILAFSEEERDLRSSYDLQGFFGAGDKVPVPIALQNLAEAANINLQELFRLYTEDNNSEIETQINSANSRLRELVASLWRQSDVHVRVNFGAGVFRIYAGSTRKYEEITERSTGYQQFVALFARLIRDATPENDIILLIDEAEMHLHYDAQADLIDMLTKQKIAKQVIYTTHSFGCLPEDIGYGTRILKQVDDDTLITNYFWTDTEPGLSPLIFGVGAEKFSFLPLRNCLLTEGATDFIILPELLRQAIGQPNLGFLISPGLSESNAEHISLLQNNGTHVSFLVDSDKAGKVIKRNIRRVIGEAAIIHDLQAAYGDECVIEDFLDSGSLANALNSVFERAGNELRIEATQLDGNFRPRKIREWCTANGLPEPNKGEIFRTLMEKRHEYPLLDDRYREGLRTLYENIVSSFE